MDIGCGADATFLRDICTRIHEGVGIDEFVTKSTRGNITTNQVRLTHSLPFPNNRFDVVTALAVLEHLEDDLLILREAGRVLKPGGRLVITVPSKAAQPVLEFLAYKLHLVSEYQIRDHKRYYNRQDLLELIDNVEALSVENHKYFQFGFNNRLVCIKSH